MCVSRVNIQRHGQLINAPNKVTHSVSFNQTFERVERSTDCFKARATFETNNQKP